jgi:hypothetical protein
MSRTLVPDREGLIHGMVRYGERDLCGVFATTATMDCEDCIASGDDCGRVYAVLRIVVEPGWDGILRDQPAGPLGLVVLTLWTPEQIEAIVTSAGLCRNRFCAR